MTDAHSLLGTRRTSRTCRTSEVDGIGWHSQCSAQSGAIVLNADLKSGTVEGVLT